ncbi:MAG TPA: response regulator transcription factor [bacterium]|jgi:DNA-binding NarL/FixJ family response regulator|nr:response regulator transcription factor [bacterium]
MKPPVHPLRLVLVDDHPLVRAGIRGELEKFPWVQVVGEAGDGREAVELVTALHPDAVFMDISMPHLNGLEALARIHKKFPEIRVIILSMHDNDEYVWRAMRAGAAGYVLKRAATAELGAALQQAMQGEIYLCQEIAARFAKKYPRQEITEVTSPLEQLTDRQREILQLIAESRNTKEIAQLLHLSTKTVEYHRLRLMRTLHVHDVPGLVRLALKAGMIAH